MLTKTQQYNLDDAISYVLEPGSEPEISELADSGDKDYEPEIIDWVGYGEEKGDENEEEPEGLPKNARKAEIHEESEEEGEREKGSQKASKTKKAKVKRTYGWRKREPVVYDTQLKRQEFIETPENAIEVTPMLYFSRFWDDNVFRDIAYHTNLYSMQQTGKSIEINEKKLKSFFGVQMTMTIIKMFIQYKIYWSPELCYERIAAAMTVKRYEKLWKFTHLTDNTTKDNPKKCKL